MEQSICIAVIIMTNQIDPRDARLTADAYTPQAYVASNDLALGQKEIALLESVSASCRRILQEKKGTAFRLASCIRRSDG